MQNKTDLELLMELDRILSEVNEAAMRRTLGWIMDKYGQGVQYSAAKQNSAASLMINPACDVSLDEAGNDRLNGADGFATLADMISSSSAKSDAQYFLLSALWLTKGDLNVQFEAKDVAIPLRECGKEMKKVSNAVSCLEKRKPLAYLVQLKKNKGRAGHRTFKLTKTGMEEAERLINNVPGND